MSKLRSASTAKLSVSDRALKAAKKSIGAAGSQRAPGNAKANSSEDDEDEEAESKDAEDNEAVSDNGSAQRGQNSDDDSGEANDDDDENAGGTFSEEDDEEEKSNNAGTNNCSGDAVKKETERCALCDKPALWYCADDHAALCAEHKQQSHALPSQQSHRLCPIEHMRETQRALPLSCEKYDPRLLLWCENCEVVCCSTCVGYSTTHQGHTTHRIAEVAGGLRHELIKQMQTMQTAQARLASDATRLLELESQLNESRAEKTIQAACDDLTDRIHNARWNLCNKLEVKAQTARKKLKARQLELDRCRSQVAVTLERGEATLQLPDHELLQQYSNLSKDYAAASGALKDLAQKPPLVARFQVNSLATTDVHVLEDASIRETVVTTSSLRRFLRQWALDGEEDSEREENAEGEEDGEFTNPSGIAVSSGSVFVADQNRIQVFDERGRFQFDWDLEDSEDSSPWTACGIAISNGRVFVTDSVNHRVQVLNKRGKFVRTWGSEGEEDGEFSSPSGIAVSNGRVFVADQRRVQAFDKRGHFLFKWDLEQSEDCTPCGIAVSNGRVFVTDTGNHRVQVFDERGKFICMWGSKGKGDGEFSNPCGLAVSNGCVFVLDDRGVQVFDEGGQFLYRWGSSGKGDYQFDKPAGIAISNGCVFVTGGGRRVQVFDATDDAGGYTKSAADTGTGAASSSSSNSAAAAAATDARSAPTSH